MARLNLDNIKKIEKDRVSVHTKVTTTYSVFDVKVKNTSRSIRMERMIVLFQKKLVNQFSLIEKVQSFLLSF